MEKNYIDSYTGCGPVNAYLERPHPGCDMSCNGELGIGCSCRGDSKGEYVVNNGDLNNE